MSSIKPAPSPQQTHPDPDHPLVWIDGEILPRSRAKVSVFDKCVLYGDGVFEGLRAYSGRVFKLRSHMRRLFRSAEAIRLTIPYTVEEIESAIRETLEANGFADAYVRVVVTRGPGELGLDIRPSKRPTVFCIADTLRMYPEEMYEKGMPIIVAQRPRIPPECLDARIKSCNYLNNILAKLEAIDAGVLEALMLRTDGFVAECTGDNVFIIKGGAVATPPGEAGILEGITREFVIGVCAEIGAPCEERMFKLDEVFGADEVFLTGTGAEIIAVSAVDERPIGDGREGPVTKRIRERFLETTRSDAPED